MPERELWVPCDIAFAVTTAELAKRLHADPSSMKHEAAAKLQELLSGQRARARALLWSAIGCDPELERLLLWQADMLRQLNLLNDPNGGEGVHLYGMQGEVPSSFWSRSTFPPLQWAFGEFDSGEFDAGELMANGVEIEVGGLPYPEAVRVAMPPAAEEAPDISGAPDRPQGGGRKPAGWWPDFAEELALYIHANGSPPGQGAEGQSAVIDAVFAAMAAAGKQEPARSSVQPVVSAVLRRIREL